MQFPKYLFSAFVAIGFYADRPALGDASLSVESVIAKIQEAEAKSHAVEVNGFTGQSFVRNDTGEFVPTRKKIEGSVIRDGVLGGRYVLDCTETIPFGSADSERFGIRAAIESYDGKVGRSVEAPKKSAVGRERQGKATIQAGPIGLDRYASWCDGSAASLGYFKPFINVEPDGYSTLGEALAAMVKQGVAFTTAQEQIGDTLAIRLSDPFENSYWFDPTKGFCLIQAITTAQYPARTYRKLVIEQFTQIDAESWYPVKGRWEDPIGKMSGTSDKVEFSIHSAALLQDADYDYKADVPAGYTVHHRILNKVFTSTGNKAELDVPIDQPTTHAIEKKEECALQLITANVVEESLKMKGIDNRQQHPSIHPGNVRTERGHQTP